MSSFHVHYEFLVGHRLCVYVCASFVHTLFVPPFIALAAATARRPLLSGAAAFYFEIWLRRSQSGAGRSPQTHHPNLPNAFAGVGRVEQRRRQQHERTRESSPSSCRVLREWSKKFCNAFCAQSAPRTVRANQRSSRVSQHDYLTAVSLGVCFHSCRARSRPPRARPTVRRRVTDESQLATVANR